MQKKTIRFGSGAVDFYLAGRFSGLTGIVNRRQAVLLTDENIFRLHPKKFSGWNVIVLPPGEEYKTQATVDSVIRQLIEKEADRQTTLIGVGGGVLTDLTGFIASVYMRGIPFGFVPTSLLAMVDASVGGKNGIDVGVYKNMVGVIRQPSFILYDTGFLETLPEKEWRNGFAEVIKHAAIKDAALFRELAAHDVAFYQKRKKERSDLIRRNALIKIKVVQQDEFEKGDRKLLNFGHTLGHALENQYPLSHGEAISIGMACAARISEQLLAFKKTGDLTRVLEQYGLPTQMQFDRERVLEVLKMDKKKTRDSIHYILLERIGRAVIRPVPIQQLYDFI